MLKSLSLTGFTVFDEAVLDFSPGVNVFIGANATGKTHLLKLAYSGLRARRALENQAASTSQGLTKFMADRLSMKLATVFRPDGGKIARLVRRARGRKKATVKLDFSEGPVSFELNGLGEIRVKGLPEELQNVQTGVFLPPREVLSIFPGFYAVYERRELAFDETYADICFSLSLPLLRGPKAEAAAELLRPLAGALRIKVSLDGDRFYLLSEDDGKIEAHLAAEGFRKIASLMHLIANGELTTDGVLFWDEPESGLNPKLIKVVADFLLRLAAHGVQVFVATHDYLLTNELSLNAEYETSAAEMAPIRFFAFSRGEKGGVDVQPGATLAELNRNPIMEEFEALYERERRLFYQVDRAH